MPKLSWINSGESYWCIALAVYDSQYVRQCDGKTLDLQGDEQLALCNIHYELYLKGFRLQTISGVDLKKGEQVVL